MSDVQKGLLAVVSAGSIGGLYSKFSFSHVFDKPLEDLTFQYVYLTARQDNFSGALQSGYVCKVKSVNVSRIEEGWEYIFEFGEIISKMKFPGHLYMDVEKKENWKIFLWDFNQFFLTFESGADDHCEFNYKRPTPEQSLSINEAIKGLAVTYGVEQSKVTISITG